MASDSTGKKLTTAEILAKARAEKGGAGTGAASEAPAAPAPAAAKPVAKPAAPAATGKPKTKIGRAHV